MNILDWAKREVEIACKKENSERKEGEFDYGCACYESALKAFESLCGDGHSGFSIKMTQSILNRLIDRKPLTPIEDTPDIWNLNQMSSIGKEFEVYQCKRMSTLFKYVYQDGTIKYSNDDCCYCVDINNPNNTYWNGMVHKIIDEMIPIKMPYMPGKPIKVYCEDFLTDPKNGDFDTVGIFYAVKETDGQQERIEINRFFKELKEDETDSWTEITEEEYKTRKEKRYEKHKN